MARKRLKVLERYYSERQAKEIQRENERRARERAKYEIRTGRSFYDPDVKLDVDALRYIQNLKASIENFRDTYDWTDTDNSFAEGQYKADKLKITTDCNIVLRVLAHKMDEAGDSPVAQSLMARRIQNSLESLPKASGVETLTRYIEYVIQAAYEEGTEFGRKGVERTAEQARMLREILEAIRDA